MYVQAGLGLILVLALLHRIVVMVPAELTVIVAVFVVAMMNMTSLVMLMNVEEKARERADRRRIGHADGGRDRKNECHRPDEGGAAPAQSFQSRHHAFRRTPEGSTTAAWPL